MLILPLKLYVMQHYYTWYYIILVRVASIIFTKSTFNIVRVKACISIGQTLDFQTSSTWKHCVGCRSRNTWCYTLNLCISNWLNFTLFATNFNLLKIKKKKTAYSMAFYMLKLRYMNVFPQDLFQQSDITKISTYLCIDSW